MTEQWSFETIGGPASPGSFEWEEHREPLELDVVFTACVALSKPLDFFFKLTHLFLTYLLCHFNSLGFSIRG